MFGKKILNFITKNPDKVVKLLEENNCDKEEFFESVQHYQQHMGSIADLRNLWIGSSNKFAKVYRIISKHYMRKHSLSGIFNSQITCLYKHLKYVKKISESINDPEHFTNMKDYWLQPFPYLNILLFFPFFEPSMSDACEILVDM